MHLCIGKSTLRRLHRNFRQIYITVLRMICPQVYGFFSGDSQLRPAAILRTQPAAVYTSLQLPVPCIRGFQRFFDDSSNQPGYWPALTQRGGPCIIFHVSSPSAILPHIDAALFDLDGTLVETNIDFSGMKRSTVDLCAKRGADRAALQQLDILAAVEHTAAFLAPEERPAFRQEAWDMLESIELSHLAGASPRPHAEELLSEMHARGIRIGIVTRNCRRATDTLLRLLPDVVTVSLSREDVSRTKPDPLHIRTALEAMDLPALSTLMAGDHLMDVQAGVAAGCITVGLLFDREPGYFDGHGAHAALRDLRELANALFHPDR